MDNPAEILSRAAVIVPSYKSGPAIKDVVEQLLIHGFSNIVVVDDCCPEGSAGCLKDLDVHVCRTPENRGVGGAFLFGANYAVTVFGVEQIEYFCKIDSDGQHRVNDLERMLVFAHGSGVDLVKGNRYLLGKTPARQPFLRKLGNVGLSFLTKLSTGFWHIDDPVNGMLVFHSFSFYLMEKSEALKPRFLFETSVLDAASRIGACVSDFPNEITYGEEHSSLSISGEILPLAGHHLTACTRRIFSEYLYPKFDLAAFGLVGAALLPLGIMRGLFDLYSGKADGSSTEPGEIAIVMMMIFIGLSSLVFFLQRDQALSLSKEPIRRFGLQKHGPQ